MRKREREYTTLKKLNIRRRKTTWVNGVRQSRKYISKAERGCIFTEWEVKNNFSVLVPIKQSI
jgi:hypothetical protein